jgi:membrane fusion protein (multidrug efflux system)
MPKISKTARAMLLAGFCLFWQPLLAQQQEPPAPLVGVKTLKPQNFVYALEFTGRVEGAQSVQVRAQVDGVVKARRYREGEWVEKGKVLFEIESAEYQARFDVAQARAWQAEAAKVKAERNFERARELRKLNSISEREYDGAEGAFVSARADLAGARAALDSVRMELDKTRVRAPISGYADMAQAQPGALVLAMSPTDSLLTTISNTREIQVIFHVPASRVRAMQELVRQKRAVFKEPVVATLLLDNDAPYPHPGVMRFGSGVVNPQTGNMASKAEFPNPEGQLASGQFVRIRLAALEFPNALLLPQSAVQYQGQTALATIVDAQGMAQVTPFDAIGPFNGQFVLTPSDALKADTTIIVEGINKVRPGMKVRVRPEAQGAIQAAQ